VLTFENVWQAKVAPNRQWFGNTRVIGQKELANFREEKDSNSVSAIEYSTEARANIFTKGQSKRIWAGVLRMCC
jgi:hypothetical protein